MPGTEMDVSEKTALPDTGHQIQATVSYSRPSPSALRPEFPPDARHQTLDTNLLAFAGDPAALGMLTRDALGPDLVQARILFLPEPLYPVLSRKRGEEGRVVLEVTISAQGAVRRAQVD
ncbi:MAG: TonB family protein, partial [bacterium]|nr:TonB family protein [bacterium]